MVDDCRALVQGYPQCHAFEGVVSKASLCPIRVHTPLGLIHVDFMSVESSMELNKPPSVKNVLVITNHFMCYVMAVVNKDQMEKTVVKVLYEMFIMVFGMPAKLLSDWGVNFTAALVEELCAMFGIQNAEPLHITCSVMGKWSGFIRCSSE